MKRIIVSLDNFEKEYMDKRLERILENKDKIHALKLSPTSFDCVDYLKSITGLKVIYDHQKLADIPWTIENIVSKISKNLVEGDGIILLGYVGSKSIESFIESCEKRNLESYVVAKMSHPKADEFLKKDAPEEICKISTELGAAGIILPVTDNYLIKKSRGIINSINPETKIAAVGCKDFISMQYAILNGADYLILGRYFFDSPKEIFEKILSL